MRKLSKNEYNAIHKWNLRHWTKAMKCEHCPFTGRTHWSNKSGDYIAYDKSDWQELCPRCHYTYDKDMFGTTWKRRGRTRAPQSDKPRAIFSYEVKRDWLNGRHKLRWGDKEQLLVRLKTYEWFTD